MNELISPAFGRDIICGGHDERIHEATARRRTQRRRLFSRAPDDTAHD